MYIEHFFVKKLIMLLLGAVFVTLVISSVEFASADHLKPGKGIFNNETMVNLIPTKNSNYDIYLQITLRNAEGQLLTVVDAHSHGWIIPHEITDYVFDGQLIGEKEIVTIDGIKYEKATFVDSPPTEELLSADITPHFIGLWFITFCAEIDGHGYTCIPMFQANTAHVLVDDTDTITLYWTILRVID
jgi:hypothetical protein